MTVPMMPNIRTAKAAPTDGVARFRFACRTAVARKRPISLHHRTELLLQPIMSEFLCDILLDSLRGRNIGVAAGCIASLQFCQASSVERTGHVWTYPQRRIVIRDCRVPLPQFERSERAGIERICIVWVRSDRLVAIGRRSLQVAKHGAGPAPFIPENRQTGFQPDRLVEIFRGALIVALFLVSHRAIGEGVGII